jgi:hypothetical protein
MASIRQYTGLLYQRLEMLVWCFLQDVNVSKATCHVWHTFTTQGAIMVNVNMLLAKHDDCGR